MRMVQQVLALVCLILLFVFCVSNMDPIPIRFLTWESPELPTFLLVVFAFLTGVVLTLIWQSMQAVTRKADTLTRSIKKDRKPKKENVAPPDEVSDQDVVTGTDPEESGVVIDNKEGEK